MNHKPMKPKSWQTADGIRLTMRPMRKSDTPLVKESLGKLSSESRRNRFFGTVREFSDETVRRLTHFDTATPWRLVRRIVDEQLFGGASTIVVTAEGAGAEVTVTESGWVESPPLRIVAKYLMGYDGTINAYLTDLAASFGETAKPAPCDSVCERTANSHPPLTPSRT